MALPETRLETAGLYICILSDQEYTAMRKSMTDCLPTLDGMTISRMLSQRRNSTRRPIGNGLASVTSVAIS